MANGRMIPATTFDDPDFGKKLSPLAMVMFIGMVVIADDMGRLRADATYLANRILSYKNLSPKKALALRNEIVTNIKSVQLYKVDDQEFIQLTKWEKYQKLRVDRNHTSNFPDPVNQRDTIDIPTETKKKVVVAEWNGIEEKRSEGKGSVKGNHLPPSGGRKAIALKDLLKQAHNKGKKPITSGSRLDLDSKNPGSPALEVA
jgi:hypothetical protein